MWEVLRDMLYNAWQAFICLRCGVVVEPSLSEDAVARVLGRLVEKQYFRNASVMHGGQKRTIKTMMPRPRQSWSRHPRLLQPPWILPTPTRHGTQGFESATRYHRYGGRDATRRGESDGTFRGLGSRWWRSPPLYLRWKCVRSSKGSADACAGKAWRSTTSDRRE